MTDEENIKDDVVCVSFGGGTNSTALLVGMLDRGISPDLIMFADTGAERPETYDHVAEVSAWCVKNGFPEIVVVQTVNKDGEKITLEELCLKCNMLPSLAYGFKACSLKHKRAPQDKYMNHWQPAIDAWKNGGVVVKYIGYDADEERRAKILSDEKYTYQYPLIEWGWGRDECVEAIARAGLTQPGKSSCFFCPSMRQNEIFELKRSHPELLDRALKIEANAQLTSVKGLGRNFAWRDLVEFEDKQCKLFPESNIEIDCGCYDGES